MRVYLAFAIFAHIFLKANTEAPQIRKCNGIRCFILVDFPKNWNKAQQYCHALGGHLAIVRNRDDANTIQYLLFGKSNQKNDDDILSYPNVPYAWIGLNSKARAGHYVTILDERLEDIAYKNWSIGEPNNSDTERCVSILPDRKLANLKCNDKLPFVCEKNVY